MKQQTDLLGLDDALELLHEELVDRTEALEQLDRTYNQQLRDVAGPHSRRAHDDRAPELESLKRRYERTRHEYQVLLVQYVLTRTLKFASAADIRVDGMNVPESDRTTLRQAVVCSVEEELPDVAETELRAVVADVIATVTGVDGTDEAA